MGSEQLTYQERMLSCVDKSAWQLDDKAWVKARKAQWAELSKKLKARDKTTLPLLEARTTNYWKSYFLTGELESTAHLVSSIGLEINPFFIMWFHPVQSEANLTQLLLKLVCEFESTGEDIRVNTASYGLEVITRCYAGQMSNPLLGEDGVFAGQERLYLRLLFGTKELGFISSESFYPLNHNFFRELSVYLLYPGAAVNWPELELVDFYLTTAARYEKPCNEIQQWRQRFTLQLIYYYDEIKNQLRPEPVFQRNAYEMVKKFKTAFEHSQLDDYLHQEWQFVTNELKNKIIPNEQLLYESIYPTYERVMKSLGYHFYLRRILF